jgi:hypothetical protein
MAKLTDDKEVGQGQGLLPDKEEQVGGQGWQFVNWLSPNDRLGTYTGRMLAHSPFLD